MRKVTLIVMLMLMMSLAMGCNSSTSDNIYDDETVVANESNGAEAVVDSSEDEATDTSDEIVDTEAGGDETGDAADDIAEDTESTDDADASEEDAEEDEAESVSEDVYSAASEPIEFDMSEFEGIEPLQITDETVIAELDDYLEKFYFNYFFTYGLEEETGNVTADAMTLFALSYIMQYEYNELKFDHETYTLYIPKDRVREIVERYFYRELDIYNVYEDLGIGLDDDTYSVVVPNGEWEVSHSVATVERLGDFTLKVSTEVKSLTSERVKERVEAIVEDQNGVYMLINYNVVEVED